MSLAIDVDEVIAVLLADGWHDVADASFTTDSYEFIYYGTDERRDRGDFTLQHGGGQSGVCATGFSFTEDEGTIVAGPLTAILAVRHIPHSE